MTTEDKGKISDGHHTFDDLYEHRILLFIALVNETTLPVWRSKKHDDGSEYPAWFIAGIELPTGPITYHIPMHQWKLLNEIPTLDKAPKWDGHTSADVINRLTKWAEDINEKL